MQKMLSLIPIAIGLVTGICCAVESGTTAALDSSAPSRQARGRWSEPTTSAVGAGKRRTSPNC